MDVNAAKFRDAIWGGDAAAVASLIAAGTDVNARPAEDEWPPLHLAIEQQHVAIVAQLLASGASANDEMKGTDLTPLLHAIDIENDAAWQKYNEVGHASTELTELLLRAGAVPTLAALDLAARYANQRAFSLMHGFARGPTAG